MEKPSSPAALDPHRPGKMTGVKVFVKGLKLEAEIGVYAHEHGRTAGCGHGTRVLAVLRAERGHR